MRPLDVLRSKGVLQGNAFPLVLGLVALALATATGWQHALERLVLSPEPIVRAVLALACLVAALATFARSVDLLHAGGGPVAVVRGVRLSFVAIAFTAAAAGYALDFALAVVLGLVIGGVDVVETTLLLAVILARRPDA